MKARLSKLAFLDPDRDFDRVEEVDGQTDRQKGTSRSANSSELADVVVVDVGPWRCVRRLQIRKGQNCLDRYDG